MSLRGEVIEPDTKYRLMELLMELDVPIYAPKPKRRVVYINYVGNKVEVMYEDGTKNVYPPRRFSLRKYVAEVRDLETDLKARLLQMLIDFGATVKTVTGKKIVEVSVDGEWARLCHEYPNNTRRCSIYRLESFAKRPYLVEL